MTRFRQKQYSDNLRQCFITHICNLEGYKTRVKNLHWAAPNKGLHEYLDDLYSSLVGYQDSVAEDFMGILGALGPLDIKSTPCDCTIASELIDNLVTDVKQFYDIVPQENLEFKGILSETENFIHTCQKYKYLFSLV